MNRLKILSEGVARGSSHIKFSQRSLSVVTVSLAAAARIVSASSGKVTANGRM